MKESDELLPTLLHNTITMITITNLPGLGLDMMSHPPFRRHEILRFGHFEYSHLTASCSIH